MGDSGWKTAFKVLANEKKFTLLTETPTVLFGESHPVRPEKPLEGQGGAKVTQWNGGSVHIFRFDCPPSEKKVTPGS
jgi:hypothetical protein